MCNLFWAGLRRRVRDRWYLTDASNLNILPTESLLGNLYFLPYKIYLDTSTNKCINEHINALIGEL